MDKQKLKKIRQIQKKEIDKYKSNIALQTLFANTHMNDTHSSIKDSSNKISHFLKFLDFFYLYKLCQKNY